MSNLSTSSGAANLPLDSALRDDLPDGRSRVYDIGTPGQPWGEAERQIWRDRQTIQRSFNDDVIAPLSRFAAATRSIAEIVNYGELDYSAVGKGRYELFAVAPTRLRPDAPIVVVTGGVHGYETSGVKGALRFLEEHFARLSERANLIVLPCISPWAYETINRWNPFAIDPNRSFNPNGTECLEAQHTMNYLKGVFARSSGLRVLVHIDLHETTDTDNSEFRPAKIARNGAPEPWSEIPDGFYLVADTEKPEMGFQEAMIAAVRRVTHIAKPDAAGNIIGEPIWSEGVIKYDTKKLFLCAGFTDARFTTTTEVYPDSPRTTPENCIQAQVECLKAGIDYALAS